MSLVSSPRPKTVQDVHILPLAREVDRAVLPFLPRQGHPAILHAHRIVLLVPDAALARRIAAKVERALRPVALVERHDLASDAARPAAGFQGILYQVSALCLRELEAGNRVHINLSSGSKLVAFAAGLAGMAHLREGAGSIYYVRPDGYALSTADFEEHGHTLGVLDVEELELMPVLMPEPLQLRALNFLRHQPDGKAEYRALLQFLAEVPGSGYAPLRQGPPGRVRNWNNAATTRMVRAVLAPLQQRGLVEIHDEGRQKAAHLTTRGLLCASLAGRGRASLCDPLEPPPRPV